jgi:hypothetical protein
MNEKNILAEKTSTTRIRKTVKPTAKPIRTAEYPQIKEAVGRAVRDYGEALKKLAKTD